MALLAILLGVVLASFLLRQPADATTLPPGVVLPDGWDGLDFAGLVPTGGVQSPQGATWEPLGASLGGLAGALLPQGTMGGFGGTSSQADQAVNLARQAVGQPYHPGEKAQCASWVGSILGTCGYEGSTSAWVPDYMSKGPKIPRANLLEGDLVIFDRTYLPLPETHIGIYTGDGSFVHRPTASGPVREDSLDSPYWSEKFNTGVRVW